MKRGLYLADRFAEALLKDAGLTLAAPVDIASVAAHLDAQIVPTQMPQDGRMVPGRDTAQLYVNANQPDARQRFTAAHELAHWLLYRPGPWAVPVRAMDAAFRSQETLCNALAGSLLMPYRWTKRGVYGGVCVDRCSALSAVAALAATADTSLAAATVRLRDVLGWQCTLLQWVDERGGLSYLGEAGLFPWEQGLLTPTRNVGLALRTLRDEARRRYRSEPFTGTIPLIIDCVEDDYPAEFMFYGRNAVALIGIGKYSRTSRKWLASEPERRVGLHDIAWSLAG